MRWGSLMSVRSASKRARVKMLLPVLATVVAAGTAAVVGLDNGASLAPLSEFSLALIRPSSTGTIADTALAHALESAPQPAPSAAFRAKPTQAFAAVTK